MVLCGVIWTPYDWLTSKGYICYMAAVVIVSIVRVALELKPVVETNLTRVSYHCCIRHYCHFNIALKQKQDEHFMYNGGCGVHGHMYIHVLRCLKKSWLVGYR